MTGLVAARLWLAPLGSSLWLDETGTYWTIQDGLTGIAGRSYSPPQSLVYFYIAGTAAALGGASEVVLRLPSVAAMGLAALLLYRLGRRLLGREGALWAALVFVCWKEVAFAACDARAYALGVLAVVAAALMLVRWLDTGSYRDGLCYAALASLTAYLHDLFAVMFLVHAGYAAYVFGTGRRPVRPANAAAVCAASGILLLPLLAGFGKLVARGSIFSYAAQAETSQLFASFAPPVVLGSILAGLLLAYFVQPAGRLAEARGRPERMLLMVLWAAVPPVALFAISLVTPYEVFVPRYFLCHVPGLALLAGWALRSIAPAHKQVIVAGALAAGALAGFGSLRHATFAHTGENWRDANRAAARMVRESRMPVVVHSGFVLPVNEVLHGDSLAISRYLAPLSLYPIPGEIIPLPYEPGQEAEQYLERLAADRLAGANRFLLVSRGGNGVVAAWLEGRFAGTFERTRTRQFGNIALLLFERRGGTAAP